ncbi:TetR-like C-terminal domain-containing protein [Aeromicrobium endophyticum]|uniref:TetR family transcriptional regulator n=1 Tax=Aeromicrobium endophyticum TaxID=2292704 RepID=A0A371PAC2_9ACTN|nr:TetR-like C-terminal domain-containing protein [Aeromicrobium endophyticum]REK72893.1 TetR family transcriptional regulator [Aeromicrobium endophyticum]
MDDGTADAAARTGRPRDEGIDDRIIAAALVELSERGIRDFSIARVARAASVARNSVYLRWDTPDELMLAAVERSARWSPIPDSGSYRTDVQQLAAVLSELIEAPSRHAQLRFLSEAQTDEVLGARYRSTVADLGMTQGREIFDRATKRGELRPGLDADLLFEMFLGGLYMSTIFSGSASATTSVGRDAYVDHFIGMTAADATAS